MNVILNAFGWGPALEEDSVSSSKDVHPWESTAPGRSFSRPKSPLSTTETREPEEWWPFDGEFEEEPILDKENMDSSTVPPVLSPERPSVPSPQSSEPISLPSSPTEKGNDAWKWPVITPRLPMLPPSGRRESAPATPLHTQKKQTIVAPARLRTLEDENRMLQLALTREREARIKAEEALIQMHQQSSPATPLTLSPPSGHRILPGPSPPGSDVVEIMEQSARDRLKEQKARMVSDARVRELQEEVERLQHAVQREKEIAKHQLDLKQKQMTLLRKELTEERQRTLQAEEELRSTQTECLNDSASERVRWYEEKSHWQEEVETWKERCEASRILCEQTTEELKRARTTAALAWSEVSKLRRATKDPLLVPRTPGGVWHMVGNMSPASPLTPDVDTE